MEKAERGFLLTGDKTCIEVYKRASGEFYAYHGHLTVLLADAPKQLELLDQIRAGLEGWQREAATPEFAAKQENRDVAGLVARGRGKDIMDDLRLQVATFERAEMDIYEKVKSRAEFERIVKTTLFALLCVFAMACWSPRAGTASRPTAGICGRSNPPRRRRARSSPHARRRRDDGRPGARAIHQSGRGKMFGFSAKRSGRAERFKDHPAAAFHARYGEPRPRHDDGDGPPAELTTPSPSKSR